jgi:hypothetical protein
LPAAAFTGRERELAQLDRALRDSELVVLAQAITGAGRVGKTQLAARYVHEHMDSYDVVAWIAAEDGGIADLSELAIDLEIDVAGCRRRSAPARTLGWLSVCEERWLLVLDNVAAADDLEGCCPSAGNGRVVITTRARAMAQYATALPVEVFETTTAVAYLVKRAQRPHDDRAAKRLATALGCLPLALAHAGAYCAAGTTFDAYLELLDELPATELFDTHPERSYTQTVASTWRVSIAAARRRPRWQRAC